MSNFVVLHVSDEPRDIPRALSAAEVITAEEGLPVQVIVNGVAVGGLLKESKHTIEPSERVEVFACQRALDAQQKSASDLLPEVGTVPAAVVALVSAQTKGAAYIRV